MGKIITQFNNAFDFDAVVMMMDDDVREATHMDIAPCTDQEFYNEYCARHLHTFKETFVFDTENPQV